MFSKVKSDAGNLIYGSAYIHTVKGFQSVMRTHCLRSNFLLHIMRGFSMYFWTIHCSRSVGLFDLFEQTSRISTKFL